MYKKIDPLDGDPKDFPERENAKNAYGEAWKDFMMCEDSECKGFYGRVMDGLQSHICIGPGPIWKDFIKTLPNYEAYWAGIKAEYKNRM